MQPLPEPELVRAIVGDQPDTAVIVHLIRRAAEAARDMTSGAGFDATGTAVEPDIGEILVRSVATSLLNPESALSETALPFSAHPGAFPDWSEADLRVLERYRDQQAGRINTGN